MTDDLVKRLRKRQEFEFIDGHKRVEWEDEDALEAAERIETLEARLKLTEDRLKQSQHWITQIRRWIETGEIPR